MALPQPPIDPMLAKLARSVPTGELLYEPKWDGFRCLIFREGTELHLQSRGGKDLGRYFPELVGAADDAGPLHATLPESIVLDGEIVVPVQGRLDFDALSNRIHPAESRVNTLAESTPAHFIAFDLLGFAGADLRAEPFETRRAVLLDTLEGIAPPVHITPATRDAATAAEWFERFEGAGLDGVIAKPLDAPYLPGKRALIKVKKERTADVVVAGWREHAQGGVGSLMLGLWDAATLVHVGVASSFSAARRQELHAELAGHQLDAGAAHPWISSADEPERTTQATPRGTNRWNATKDTSWRALAPDLVAEVAFDQLSGDRFRHSARFRRWRPDRDAASCTFDQLDVAPPSELAELFQVADRR